MGRYDPSRSKFLPVLWGNFCIAIRIIPLAPKVAILGAAAITPMIHSRYFALPCDWYHGFSPRRLFLTCQHAAHDLYL